MDPNFPLVWRLEKKHAGSGALGDIGSHAADLARYLNAEFDSVTAHMTTFIKERPLPGGAAGAWGAKGSKGKGKVTVDDDANFLARFKNGSVGVFESSRFCGGRRNYNTFQIYGSKASIAFNLERMNELEFYDRTEGQADQGFKTIIVTESVHPYVGAWWPPGHIIGYEHTFVHAVHDFLTALEKDRLPSPNFGDGVKNPAGPSRTPRTGGRPPSRLSAPCSRGPVSAAKTSPPWVFPARCTASCCSTRPIPSSTRR